MSHCHIRSACSTSMAFSKSGCKISVDSQVTSPKVFAVLCCSLVCMLIAMIAVSVKTLLWDLHHRAGLGWARCLSCPFACAVVRRG
jgi:hypothetical protein